MCTVATWKNNQVSVVTGRNMDWKTPMATKLWILPSGQKRISHTEGNQPMEWTSKYGSIIASCFDATTADGMNEKGLSAHALWLAESDYGTPDPSLPSLSISYWAQYFLDNFTSVNEAIQYIADHPFNLIGLNIPGDDRPATVHLILNDSEGDTAVLEYIDGSLHTWVGKEYDVITNSPTFGKQLENIKKYEGFGGSQQLPGDTEADSRFVRATYYLNRLQPPKDERMSIAGIISVLRNAAQPYSTPDPDRPNISPTIWRTVCDHTNLRYFFESTDSPFLTWINLDSFDLKPDAETLMYDTEAQKDAYGEINHLFKSQPLFTFL